ncbi:50S ribosomal protein L18 [Candidatus Gugararchaeum adminiculabundum]|nr:50S ribosomal protein L18 [Candidatus Gugararchaeum adminiculabundum]
MGRARGPTYSVKFRRRRESLTNYSKRLALVQSETPRLVVRKSNRGVRVQFIEYDAPGDKTIAAADSKALVKMGWPAKCNSPTAYLTAMLAAVRAKKKGISKFVLDIGLNSPSKGSVVFAALKGALDAGLQANAGEGLFDEKRIRGEHLKTDAALFDKTKAHVLKQ